MIEANEKTQLLYASEKREKIIIEQESIIKNLSAEIELLRANRNNFKVHLLWALFWLTSLCLLALFLE